MPTTKHKIINDPKLNAWIFDQLTNLTVEQKSHLSPIELRRLRSNTSVRQYITWARETQLDILLAKIGIQTAKIFYVPQVLDAAIVKKAYKQSNADSIKAEVIEDMIKQGIFVTDSFVVAQGLGLMSANCHSQAWQINSSFLKINQQMGSLKAHFMNISENRVQLEAMEGYNMLVHFMFVMCGIEGYLLGRKDFQTIDLAILTLLSYFEPRYVEVDFIKRMLVHKFSASSVGVKCSKLFLEKGFIDRMPSEQKVYKYKITTKGRIALNEVVHHILNHEMR